VLRRLTSLTFLPLDDNRISDIRPLRGLTALNFLYLSGSNLIDIDPLSGLTALTDLGVYGSSVSDISALRGLTRLTSLFLRSNPNLSNIGPLLGNRGLGVGDDVDLQFTSVSCWDMARLRFKGVTVLATCP
jgi:internalin A